MKYMVTYPVTRTERELVDGTKETILNEMGGLEGLKILDVEERIKMVKAMEFIARHVNDEPLFWNIWASYGVADGDIDYGDLTVQEDVENDPALGYVEKDDDFSELMTDFLRLMGRAGRDGLYCDNVLGTTGVKKYKVSGKYFMVGDNSDKAGHTDVYDYSDTVWARNASEAEDRVVGSLVRQMRDYFGSDSINIARPEVKEVE